MLGGDTQSTEHMQGIQSVVVALAPAYLGQLGSCLPVPAYLLLPLGSPASWKDLTMAHLTCA